MNNELNYLPISSYALVPYFGCLNHYSIPTAGSQKHNETIIGKIEVQLLSNCKICFSCFLFYIDFYHDIQLKLVGVSQLSFVLSCAAFNLLIMLITCFFSNCCIYICQAHLVLTRTLCQYTTSSQPTKICFSTVRG